jgi:hypothetical protein
MIIGTTYRINSSGDISGNSLSVGSAKFSNNGDISGNIRTGLITFIPGQTLTSSPGYGTTYVNRTSTYAQGTIYTNTTGRPLFVTVSLNCNAGGGYVQSYALVNETIVYSQEISSTNAITVIVNFPFFVPAGANYRMGSAGAGGGTTATVLSWFEL